MSSAHETFTFRSARPDDIPRLVELLEYGALEEGKEDPEDVAAYEAALAGIQAAPPSDLLVAERDGAVVGVCQLIVFRHFQARGGLCAEIESVHVHRDHRSAGIGGQLVEEAVVRAVDAGCYRVQLTSNLARADAHRFYLRHGFEPTHQGFKRRLR